VCGILIDISTLPLFAGCSFQGRLDFLVKNPYSGIFLHWFVGTGFVFQYSTFVVLVREVIRPGVLWFINNPNDPQFHPVQEMAERPILSSIKKMCTSAIIYFILLMIGMGLATLLISKYSGIYPVLWSFK
jgi:E3 ubiquitin-protein ligase DOA10